jgi:hypothetical protein
MIPTLDSRRRIRFTPRMKAREFHGMARTRLYYIWIQMRYRCYSPKCVMYHRYGGRGIRVCEQWFQSFLSFKAWALSHGYADNLTIDRIENDGNYEPGNCQWLTKPQNVSKALRGKPRQRKAS